jgi:hypothetical protein
MGSLIASLRRPSSRSEASVFGKWWSGLELVRTPMEGGVGGNLCGVTRLAWEVVLLQ